MNPLLKLKTLGALKKSKYTFKNIKTEIRDNLIANISSKKKSFEGINGFENTVIPETETALLSQHNILFLGLRGQAKTRIARQMINLLDEYIPIIKDTEINDNPLEPISHQGQKIVAQMGDKTPIEWLHRSHRFTEKLATPDVSVADLIGDIDPIKAANLKIALSSNEVINYGLIPRSHRGIFVINELPDLQSRIQVSLFNILQEQDIQIRGFKIRLPLDILFIFTANPEDYTNRGSIVTPLKDRIQSQIITHYPKNIEDALAITEQEVKPQQSNITIDCPDVIKRLIEQIAIEARQSEYIDPKSGVSARLTIAARENCISSAERRAIINHETQTQVRITDLWRTIPAITGKIELVYEGEQTGAAVVAENLINKSLRTLFKTYFPNPELLKQKAKSKENPLPNPYASIIKWFDAGHQTQIPIDASAEQYLLELNKIDGLHALVKTHYKTATPLHTTFLMEFVLHGLAAYSLISKQLSNNVTQFSDLFSVMMKGNNENEF
jgi:magnesium chelatase subunit I